MNHESLLDSTPLLSICISTYNRIHKTVPTVIKILTCDDKRFEVVVRDNCSKDSTLRILNEIADPRLRVIAGMENLGGVGGILESLAQGHGTFLMVCLDKDLVEPTLIPGLLDLLESLSSVGVGFCEVVSNSVNPYILYSTGFPAIHHLGYRVRHPTGYFFRNKDYTMTVSRLNLTQKTTGGFPFELLSAQIATTSELAVINSPIIVTETKEEAQQYKSLTYKGGSAFFLPRQKVKVFKAFLSHLETLNLTTQDKLLIAKGLFDDTLHGITDAYSSVLRDIPICEHYGVTPRSVSSTEKTLNIVKFFFVFLACAKYPNFITRLQWAAHVLLLRSNPRATMSKLYRRLS